MLKRMIVPLLFGLVGSAILISLGVWQMQRLTWKEAILADIETRITAAPVAIPAMPDPVADKYLPVTARGEITGDEVHVLVSQKQIGAGYRIIAAFELLDGRRVLLDRGFVKVQQKEAMRPTGMSQVVGNLHWPDEKGSSIPEPDLKAEIWFARDVPALAAHLNTEPVLIIARNVDLADDPVAPLPVDSASIPNDHLQYALTWFSLALIWMVMTLAFLWRARGVQKGS
ncbi:SURF1 family protein [Planktotalea arctica]|uniref:SURF1 family protein n=1 Tax=Planktotalea arctica TaxID=1481893 RepID=UPI00321AF5B0